LDQPERIGLWKSLFRRNAAPSQQQPAPDAAVRSRYQVRESF
jgi:hypothetical protein